MLKTISYGASLLLMSMPVSASVCGKDLAQGVDYLDDFVKQINCLKSEVEKLQNLPHDATKPAPSIDQSGAYKKLEEKIKQDVQQELLNIRAEISKSSASKPVDSVDTSPKPAATVNSNVSCDHKTGSNSFHDCIFYESNDLKTFNPEGKSFYRVHMPTWMQHGLNGEQSYSQKTLLRAIEEGLLKDLQGANLLKADLRGINLAGVKFNNANLRYANLAGTNFDKADYAGADLEGATWTDGITICGAHSIGRCNLSP